MKPPVMRDRKRVIINVLAVRDAIKRGTLSSQDQRTVAKFLPDVFADELRPVQAVKA
jgi:hypothetical protein